MVVKRSESRAIRGVKTAELDVMPWKNSSDGPLPVSRTFKTMRPVSIRRKPGWSEGVSAAMFITLFVAARLRQEDHISKDPSTRLSDILAILRIDNLTAPAVQY